MNSKTVLSGAQHGRARHRATRPAALPCTRPAPSRPAARGRPRLGPTGPVTTTVGAVTDPASTSADTTRPGWTFLTNHGHVLVCIASDPGIRGRDIAGRVGITERAAQAIIADLVAGGYVRRTKVGRRNHYEIVPDQPLRHPVEQPHRVGELLAGVAGLPALDAVAARAPRPVRARGARSVTT